MAIGQTFRQADLSLPKFIAEKETDHLAWANAIWRCLPKTTRTSITVQTDSHKCGLGQFLDGDKADMAAASDPELARLFQEIREPHDRLHKSAEEIKKHLANRQKAYGIFQSDTLPALAETQAELRQLKQRAEDLVGGMQQASTIYATQTIPALNQVKTLLGTVIKTAGENIMTDEEMLEAASGTRTGNIVLVAVALPLGIFLAWIIAQRYHPAPSSRAAP
ncbi:MAG: CZB domain-containing protein [Syntrophotaleaceae bacterium]